MNISLKTYLPRLAELLGVTVGVLYERQRVLVKAGLLYQEPGRGPGSGVRLSTEAVALLLIALLGSDDLADVAVTTQELAAAAPMNPCRLTSKTTFLEALVEVLSSEKALMLFRAVVVSRTTGTAQLLYSDPENEDQEDSATTVFAAQSAHHTRKFAVNAELWRTEFHAIAISLREMLAMALVGRLIDDNIQKARALAEKMVSQLRNMPEENQ